MKQYDVEQFVNERFESVYGAIKNFIDNYNSKTVGERADCFDSCMGLIRNREHDLWGYIDGIMAVTDDVDFVAYLDDMKQTYRTFLTSYRKIYMK